VLFTSCELVYSGPNPEYSPPGRGTGRGTVESEEFEWRRDTGSWDRGELAIYLYKWASSL